MIGDQFTDRVSDTIRSEMDLLVRAVVNCNGSNKSPLANMTATALKDWIDREKAEIKTRNIQAKFREEAIKRGMEKCPSSEFLGQGAA